MILLSCIGVAFYVKDVRINPWFLISSVRKLCRYI